jgi:mRNA-degrading endonuclease RelE of RelBE toxin-antitoxin system
VARLTLVLRDSARTRLAALRDADKEVFRRALRAISALPAEPYPAVAVPWGGSGFYRLHDGPVRVMYEIDEDKQAIYILDVSVVSLRENAMSTQPDGIVPPDGVAAAPPNVVDIGGEKAVVVSLTEYRAMKALADRATPEEREDAWFDAAIAEAKEWEAAGRPSGTVPHELVVAEMEARWQSMGRPTAVRIEWRADAQKSAVRFMTGQAGMRG